MNLVNGYGGIGLGMVNSHELRPGFRFRHGFVLAKAVALAKDPVVETQAFFEDKECPRVIAAPELQVIHVPKST